MTKEELELLSKKVTDGTATKEEAEAFLAEVSKLLDEVLKVAEAKDDGTSI